MKRDTNKMSQLKFGQLEKNPELTGGFPRQATNMIKETILDFGDIFPITVCKSNNETMYNIVKGQHLIKIMESLDYKNGNIIVVDEVDVPTQRFLSLKLSLINDNMGPIDQGAIIEQLINENNMTLTEIAQKIGKSKAWVSKTLSKKTRLSSQVQKLVTDNIIAPRTAEELTKLDKNIQDEIVPKIVNGKLNKDKVHKIVALYNDKNTSDELKAKILNDPLSVSLLEFEKKAKNIPIGPKDDFKNSLQKCINMLIRVKDDIEKQENIQTHEETLKTLEFHADQLVRIIKNMGKKLPRNNYH
ncbi:MAG: hypothetical protein LBG48_01460 [Rickettsiales bacterium]|nr:hypothetical protein [Rickettsiales bacterium]